MEKNNKKIINGWCMYDWANSVYSLTITTAVFPIYYASVTDSIGTKEGGLTFVDFLGFHVNGSVLYSYAISCAFLLVAFLNPFLSVLSDIGGKRKSYLQFFCYMGALACCGLYFFNGKTLELGIFLSIIGAMGFAGSQVFYNSYLPEIATPDRMDKVSAKGFSLGYAGSVLLLILNLAMIMGVEDPVLQGEMTRWSFVTVGLWWMGFAQFTFRVLKVDKSLVSEKVNVIKKGIEELSKVWQQVKQRPVMKTYLIGFFFYSMGMQTIMYLATIFGEDVVNLETGELITLVLILQLIAIPGAYLCSLMSKRYGNIATLIVTLVLWLMICMCSYFLGEGMKTEFYILGAGVGFLMGGSQSLSRSTYAKYIPEDTHDHASFFSFYETLEKFSIATGTFVYGFVAYLTGNMNYSALSLGVFFVLGFIFLIQIANKRNA